MKCTPRQKIYFAMATGVFLLHLATAPLATTSFACTMYGDALPCVFLIFAILAMRENFRSALGILPMFWKVFAAALAMLLFSQAFWFYYDWRRFHSTPSPVLGDTMLLVSQVLFLSALALRPHSASERRDLRIRALDFVLLSLWWLCLYAYFALPWQILFGDLSHYNPAYYLLVFLQHIVIIAALTVLSIRKTGPWRVFYLQSIAAFVLSAAGNLLASISIDGGTYCAGSFYDTPTLAALYLFVCISCFGAGLQPQEDSTPNREIVQSVWTARIAMLVMLSLPTIALWGLGANHVPPAVATFRLRLVFVFMFALGALFYLKLNWLSRELIRLVRLTSDSIENLKSVQQQVSQSEKFVALGRLAAGAAHEISNPLTAILGYSELLADIPSLPDEDRAQAQQIREQVHRAQAAVTSLRNTLRQNSAPASLLIDKKPVS